MKQAAKNALKHPLVYGSSIVVFGGLFANIFNFLFNVFMYRSYCGGYWDIGEYYYTYYFSSITGKCYKSSCYSLCRNYFAKGELASVRGLYITFVRFLLIVGIIGFALFISSLTKSVPFFILQPFGIALR